MKKYVVTLAAVLILIFSAVGCAGLGDYEIPIHSGYYITRLNASEIFLTHDKPDSTSHDIIISGYITGYWSNMDYIVVELKRGIYYIVEVATRNVSDPFKTKEELEVACLELDLDISEGWITTSP